MILAFFTMLRGSWYPENRVYSFAAKPAVCTGRLTDPRTLGEYTYINMPVDFAVDDNMILPPNLSQEPVEIILGPPGQSD